MIANPKGAGVTGSTPLKKGKIDQRDDVHRLYAAALPNPSVPSSSSKEYSYTPRERHTGHHSRRGVTEALRPGGE